MQKYETYKYVTWGVIGAALLAFPAFIAVIKGKAVPYIFPPSETEAIFGLALILAVFGAGVVANRLVASQLWKAVGREAGLSPAEGEHLRGTLPDDDATIGKSILSGTVRGRPVRAHVYTRKTSDDDVDDPDTSSQTFTRVETDLEMVSNDGVIVMPPYGMYTKAIEGSPTVQDDQFMALATVEAHARALLTGDAREALLSMKEFNVLLVGETDSVYEDALPDYGEQGPDIGGFSVASMVQEGIESLFSSLVVQSDPRTVTHMTEGEVLDPDELRHQVDGVVTVAEVFEEAQTDANKA